jgi:hypothetical protein
MDPFSTLEITFVVNNMPTGAEDVAEAPAAGGLSAGGSAWIGGTFTTDEGEVDWIEFFDQSTDFQIGVPFSVVLDFGDTPNTHGEATWGYITVVQTDVQDSANFFDVFIHSITIDGRDIRFNDEALEVGFERGVRIPLTNVWSDDPVVSGPAAFGGPFTRMEVILAIVEFGNDVSFAGMSPAPFEGAESATPPATGNVGGGIGVNDLTEEDDGSSFPMWVIPVIAVVVVLAFVIYFVISKKKK